MSDQRGVYQRNVHRYLDGNMLFWDFWRGTCFLVISVSERETVIALHTSDL